MSDTHVIKFKCSGETIYAIDFGDGHGLHVNESTSEQCEGCGRDIIETGKLRPGMIPLRLDDIEYAGTVICQECDAHYPYEEMTEEEEAKRYE